MYSDVVSIGAPKTTPVAPFSSPCVFRLPAQAGRVLWQITNLCNYRCCYCIFSSGSAKAHGELSTAAAISVLDQLVELNFRSVKITGGEPFARPDLIEILQHAHALNCAFDVSTNASLINKELARQLALTKPAMVHVSVDGHCARLHDTLRGRGTFARTLAGLRRLLDEGIYVRIGCVVSRLNEEHLEKMASWCEAQGVDELIFSRMEPAGRMTGDLSFKATRTDEDLADEAIGLSTSFSAQLKIRHAFRSVMHEGRPAGCPGGSRFLYLDNLGHIAPCSWIVDRTPSAATHGSLANTPLRELMEEQEIRAFRCQTEQARKAGFRGCPAAKEVHQL
jgi:MoaA/NifB/PqqE/SkfB family radical SAM enzyme